MAARVQSGRDDAPVGGGRGFLILSGREEQAAVDDIPLISRRSLDDGGPYHCGCRTTRLPDTGRSLIEFRARL